MSWRVDRQQRGQKKKKPVRQETSTMTWSLEQPINAIPGNPRRQRMVSLLLNMLIRLIFLEDDSRSYPNAGCNLQSKWRLQANNEAVR
jgi:hypothetical protein